MPIASTGMSTAIQLGPSLGVTQSPTSPAPPATGWLPILRPVRLSAGQISNFSPDANNGAGACVDQTKYVLTLTPDYATIEPSGSYKFTAKVTDQNGNPPAISVPINVKVEVDPTSGGHDGSHTAPRPKGTVSPATGTNAFDITFTSTEVSGTHTITATCDLCTNSPRTATVDVKVDGLRTIIASPTLYTFIGGEPGDWHHDNHYLTNNAFNQLAVLAINYHFLYPNDPVLHLNDASLEWGGNFDIKGHWAGDHKAHKRGTVIDVRANTASGNIPERLFTDFVDLASGTKKQIAGRVVSAKAKLHCSAGFDPATNCVWR